MVFQVRDLTQPDFAPHFKKIQPESCRSLGDRGTGFRKFRTSTARAGKPGWTVVPVKVGLRARRPPLDGPPCRVELTLMNLETGGAIRVGSGNSAGILPPDVPSFSWKPTG